MPVFELTPVPESSDALRKKKIFYEKRYKQAQQKLNELCEEACRNSLPLNSPEILAQSARVDELLAEYEQLGEKEE